MSRRGRDIARWGGAGVLAWMVWIAEDLYLPRPHDLGSFDPVRVASLETAMWRSYYDHHAFDLFNELTQLLRRE